MKQDEKRGRVVGESGFNGNFFPTKVELGEDEYATRRELFRLWDGRVYEFELGPQDHDANLECDEDGFRLTLSLQQLEKRLENGEAEYVGEGKTTPDGYELE